MIICYSLPFIRIEKFEKNALFSHNCRATYYCSRCQNFITKKTVPQRNSHKNFGDLYPCVDEIADTWSAKSPQKNRTVFLPLKVEAISKTWPTYFNKKLIHCERPTSVQFSFGRIVLPDTLDHTIQPSLHSSTIMPLFITKRCWKFTLWVDQRTTPNISNGCVNKYDNTLIKLNLRMLRSHENDINGDNKISPSILSRPPSVIKSPIN